MKSPVYLQQALFWSVVLLLVNLASAEFSIDHEIDYLQIEHGDGFFQALCEWDETTDLFFDYVQDKEKNNYTWVGWEQERWDLWSTEVSDLLIDGLKKKWKKLNEEDQCSLLT